MGRTCVAMLIEPMKRQEPAFYGATIDQFEDMLEERGAREEHVRRAALGRGLLGWLVDGLDREH